MKCTGKGLTMVLPALILAGCGIFEPAANEDNEYFLAAEWNVQALFDGQETGNEYGEYLEAAGWTREKYAARITVISRAILQMSAPKQKVPDIIGLVEIENSGVLGDLIGQELSKHGYLWTAFAKLPGSSLGIGLMSRFPLENIRTHSITSGEGTAPRPVLEARVSPRGKPLVFLLCHWKSKLGDIDITEAQRRSSARVVQRRLMELRNAEPGTPVIVMGDLNENHDEFYRSSKFSALLPDDPLAAEIAANGSSGFPEKGISGVFGSGDFLVLSGEKPPRSEYFPEDTPALYSPWSGELNEGSYHYRGEWETIDHFLLSDALFDGMGWEYSGSRVLNMPPFVTAGGVPDAYIPRSGRGLSDHLPLLLYLRDLPASL